MCDMFVMILLFYCIPLVYENKTYDIYIYIYYNYSQVAITRLVPIKE